MSKIDYLRHFRDECKIFLAQSILRLENIECSDLQTRQLLDHAGIDAKVEDEDAVIMRNMVSALDYLKAIDLDQTAIDDSLFIRINSLLAEEQAAITGCYRTGSTRIDCITEDIPAPDHQKIQEEFARLSNLRVDTFRMDIAECFCTLVRMQPFYDGNKRSALFLCNVALFKKELGMFVIPLHQYAEFNDRLREYYVQGSNALQEFIASKLLLTYEEMLPVS